MLAAASDLSINSGSSGALAFDPWQGTSCDPDKQFNQCTIYILSIADLWGLKIILNVILMRWSFAEGNEGVLILPVKK
jgi:hypothetical protein